MDLTAVLERSVGEVEERRRTSPAAKKKPLAGARWVASSPSVAVDLLLGDRVLGDRAVLPGSCGAGDDWREQAAGKLLMGKLGQPDEIADFVVLLLCDRSGVVTGSVIGGDRNVLGGLDQPSTRLRRPLLRV